MAHSLIADSSSLLANPMPMAPTPVGNAQEYPSLMPGLPYDCVVRTFSHTRVVRRAAEEILRSLNEQKSTNQWLVILGLSEHDIQELDAEDGHCLGAVNYRFQWEETTGLFKVVPGQEHEAITHQFEMEFNHMLSVRGITRYNRLWMGSATYKSGNRKGKQADTCYVPPSRRQMRPQKAGWPSFVIETGVSESLSRLRIDAKKWLADSEGDVRMVMVIAVAQNYVDIELWQLAPTSAPRTLTKAYIDRLCAIQPNMPPLTRQASAIQQPYCAKEIVITQAGADWGPLVIPFQAFHDQPSNAQQQDFVLTNQDFEQIARAALRW